MADLSAEIVLVTGASRGIGAAIAERLRADGATVIGTATTQSGADALGKSLATPGQVLDVTTHVVWGSVTGSGGRTKTSATASASAAVRDVDATLLFAMSHLLQRSP